MGFKDNLKKIIGLTPEGAALNAVEGAAKPADAGKGETAKPSKDEYGQQLYEQWKAQQAGGDGGKPSKWEKLKGGAGAVASGATKTHLFLTGWLPIIIVFVVTIIFGGILQFFFPLLLIAGIGIGIFWIVFKKKPVLAIYILAFIIIAMLIGFLFFSPIAKQYGVDFNSLYFVGKESTKATAPAQQQVLTTLGCITGSASCDALLYSYKSDEANTEYVESTKNVGARVSDLGPARDFESETPLAIQGIINAKGFLGNNIIAEISARTVGLKEDAARALGMNASLTYDWDCDGNSNTDDKDSDNNILHLVGKNIQNKYFTCEHDAVDVKKGSGVVNIPVEVVTASKGTATMAGKQFVLTTPEVFATIKTGDALGYFGYDESDFRSLQLGDDSVNLGISSTTKKDVLITDFDNYIAVQVTNTGSGKVKSDEYSKIIIFVPEILSNYYKSNDFNVCTEATAKDVELIGKAIQGNVYTCEAKKVDTKLKALESGSSATWHYKFNVPSSEIFGEGATFAIVAFAKYNYENSQSLQLEVSEAR